MVQKILRKSDISNKTKGTKRKKHVCVAIGAPAYRRTIERRATILYTNINHHVVVVVVVYLTLTDPPRIQPWSQDRRDQTTSKRKSEISKESRQKRTDKKVASKGHRRDTQK